VAERKGGQPRNFHDGMDAAMKIAFLEDFFFDLLFFSLFVKKNSG
jgi:hypothetical protein